MSGSGATATKAVLFCTCSGACPSMATVDFWALAERVRLGNRPDNDGLTSPGQAIR